MMVVPEKVLPVPPPSEEERPPPLPECSKMSATSATLKIVCRNAST